MSLHVAIAETTDAPVLRPEGFRRLAGVLLVAAAALLVALARVSPSASVNDVRVPLGREWTVADCAASLGLRTRTGDVFDVDGEVISAGGGQAAMVWINGQRSSLDAKVSRGDKLRFDPAADITEPVADTVKYVYSPGRLTDGTVLPSTERFIHTKGIERTRWGLLSGKTISDETTLASAVVFAASSPQRPKCVALTFDDGPNRGWTPKVLDTLRELDAQGTFFVLGQAVRPVREVVQREVDEGHEVGTHSWSHRDFRGLSDAEAEGDLSKCLAAMKEGGVETVRWFRPPYGEYTNGTRRVAKKLGMSIALWDVDTRDWQKPGAEKIHARIIRGAKDGAVILLHDGPRSRAQTLEALRTAVVALRRQGYHMVTMSAAKGLSPVFSGTVVLRVGETEFTLTPLPPVTRVTVNGSPLDMPVLPLRTDGELLVPLRDICRAVGADISYDRVAETVTVDTGSQDVVFRLDSIHAAVNGAETELRVPPVLYGGKAFGPLSVLKSVLGISCVHDEVHHELRLGTLEKAELPRLPFGFIGGKRDA